jgi:hypothetical protein
MPPRISLCSIQATIFVMPALVALVAGIHVLWGASNQRRGWPEQVRP